MPTVAPEPRSHVSFEDEERGSNPKGSRENSQSGSRRASVEPSGHKVGEHTAEETARNEILAKRGFVTKLFFGDKPASMCTPDELANQKEQMKQKLDIVVYAVFAGLFATVVLGNRPVQADFWMVRNIDSLIVGEEMGWNYKQFATGFGLVYELGDVMTWVEDILVGIVLGNPVSGPRYGEDAHTVFESNVLVGNRIRMRQLRVKAREPCERSPAKLKEITQRCWPSFSSEDQQKEPYGPLTDPNDPNSGLFRWQKTAAMNSMPVWGQINVYPSEGYIYDLGPTGDDAVATLQFLVAHDFLDIATRALFLDFALYNPNSHLFLVIQFSFEMPPTGGLIRKYQARLVKLWRDMTLKDLIFLGLELFLMIYIMYYIFHELWEMLTGGFKAYVTDLWNVMDFTNYTIFTLSILFRVFNMIHLGKIELRSDMYTDLQKLAFFAKQEENLMAVNAFFTFFKMFQYLALFPKLTMLFRTLGNAAMDIVLFIVMFFICFWGFLASFYLAFGNDLYTYRTLAQTAFSLMRMLMGDYEFAQLNHINRVLAPALFAAYTLLAAFILINMFLAILNDSFVQVKAEAQEAEEKGEDALENFVDDLLGDGVAGDDEIDMDEMTEVLQMKGGMSEYEAKEKANELMEQYDADGDGDIDENEMLAMKAGMQATVSNVVTANAHGFKTGGGYNPIELAQNMASTTSIEADIDLAPLSHSQVSSLRELDTKLKKMVDRSEALVEYTNTAPASQKVMSLFAELKAGIKNL